MRFNVAMDAPAAPLYFVEREYPVSLDRLWKAWTDAAELQGWYCPTDLTNVPGSVVSDAVVGGWWTVAVDASAYGHIAYFYGKYTEVVPQTLLVHTMHYTQDEAEFRARDLDTPQSIIRIDLEAREGGAWSRFSQFGELPAEQVPLARAGMESYFDNLARHLAS